MKTNKDAAATVKGSTGRKSHVIFRGNRLVIIATREAIGAMKYKAQK